MRPVLDRVQSGIDDSSGAVATHQTQVHVDFPQTSEDASASVEDVRASAPAGVAITNQGESLLVTPPTAGAVPIGLTWVQYDHTRCSATGQIMLQVRAAAPTLVRFKQDSIGGAGVSWTGDFVGTFQRARAGDASPVRIVVRTSRRGTLVPPRSGAALLDTIVPMDDGHVDLKRSNALMELTLAGGPSGYRLYLGPRLPSQLLRHYLRKLAFAVEITQAGRRIGALSSGLICRERRIGRNRDIIVGYTCRATGLRRSP
ncbi:MAG: hypothetical protein QOE65_134 [Solirubrobacteraceae bacterium]|nr:hypothetical protein [Solirubrobacteraceae bacterium]